MSLDMQEKARAYIEHGPAEAMTRLMDALQRAVIRKAPELRVRTQDLATMFDIIKMSTQVAKASDTNQRVSKWKRILAILREPSPPREAV